MISMRSPNSSQNTANRYQELLKTHAVAPQDTDNAVGALAANQATVEADQATVRQLFFFSAGRSLLALSSLHRTVSLADL